MAEEDGEETKVEISKPLYGSFLLPCGSQTARYEGQYLLKAEKEPESLAGTSASGAEGEDPVKLPVRNGQGVYKLDGNVYEGEWIDDKMHGRGLFKFMSGDSYDGDWANNRFHGQGKYHWKCGAYYIGSWEENRMHGDGTFTDVEGREWKGRFYNGQGPGLHTLEAP